MHFFFYDRNLFPIQDILEVPDRGKSMYWLILKNKTFFLVHKIQYTLFLHFYPNGHKSEFLTRQVPKLSSYRNQSTDLQSISYDGSFGI